MKLGIRLTLLGFVVAFGVQQALAADSSPELAKQGKVLFEDDFSRPDIAPKWRKGKGFFTVKDGVVEVAENPDDKHGAYAYVTPNFQYKDIVAQFSVKAGSYAEYK